MAGLIGTHPFDRIDGPNQLLVEHELNRSFVRERVRTHRAHFVGWLAR
jgi:hypothetical protein